MGNKSTKSILKETKVAIRPQLLKTIPFGKNLQARVPIATILGYLGDSEEIYSLL